MDKKKWYVSKSVWAGIIGILLGLYASVSAFLLQGCNTDPMGLCYHLPGIPEWVFSALAALGIYGRVTANTTIAK